MPTIRQLACLGRHPLLHVPVDDDLAGREGEAGGGIGFSCWLSFKTKHGYPQNKDPCAFVTALEKLVRGHRLNSPRKHLTSREACFVLFILRRNYPILLFEQSRSSNKSRRLSRFNELRAASLQNESGFG